MKKLILLILIVNFSVSNSLNAAGIPDRIISLAPRVVVGIEEMAECLK